MTVCGSQETLCKLVGSSERGILAVFGNSIYYVQCLLQTNTFFATSIATQMRRNPFQKKKTHTQFFPLQRRHQSASNAMPSPHLTHSSHFMTLLFRMLSNVRRSIMFNNSVFARMRDVLTQFFPFRFFIHWGFFFWLLSCSSLCHTRIRGTFGERSRNKEWAEALKEVTSRIMAAMTAIHIAFGRWGMKPTLTYSTLELWMKYRFAICFPSEYTAITFFCELPFWHYSNYYYFHAAHEYS